jgi:Pyruvate/2-oxoacid:ferredoxin oxidoreductase delta subunit
MKNMRSIIEIDEEKCNGCGNCVLSCAEGAIQIIDGKAKLVSETYCDGLGACLGDCPVDALKIVEREVDEFDEEAAMAHVKKLEQAAEKTAPEPPSDACGCQGSAMRSFAPAPEPTPAPAPPQGGCPGSSMRSFSSAPPAGSAQEVSADKPIEFSALSHWPLQLRLVPPSAPFLKGADLLVAADCVPVAYPSFHRDFLSGRPVVIACPKFEDQSFVLDRFVDIFTHGQLRRVTVVVMEVPCCQALPRTIMAAHDKAGSNTPVEMIVVSIRGDIISQRVLTEEQA